MDTIQIGAWEADLKEHLLEALAKRSADGAAGNTKSPLRARQTLRNFGAYMTSGDCDRMRDSTVGISKLDVLASRMQAHWLAQPCRDDLWLDHWAARHFVPTISLVDMRQSLVAIRWPNPSGHRICVRLQSHMYLT